MTWKELKPILYERFDNKLHYYNDLRKGYRRIKIFRHLCSGIQYSDIVDFVKSIDSSLEVGIYTYREGEYECDSVVIKFAIENK